MKLPNSRNPNPDLAGYRRALIMTAWLDYKLFGYLTESAKEKAKQIQRLKKGQKKNTSDNLHYAN